MPEPESTESLSCPDCGETFTATGKMGVKAVLGLHRYREHGVAGSGHGSAAARSRRRKPATRNRTVAPKAPPAPTLIGDEAPPPVAMFDAEAEIVPKRRRHWKEWFTSAAAPKAPGEIRPAKVGRPRKSSRTSFAAGGSLIWMGLSQVAASTGNTPVSRALQLQSGIAGEVLDNAVAGSKLDRLVQPFIGETDRFKDVGMLLAFPALVLACQHNPDNPMTASLLEMVVRQNLHQLAEGVRKAKLEDRKLADTVETLTGVGMELGDNPVHTILSMIFAPVEQQSGLSGAPAADPGTVPPSSPSSSAAGPPPFASPVGRPQPEPNGSAGPIVRPAVEPLPFGATIVAPSDVPPGL
jgi:hypothetical protein